MVLLDIMQTWLQTDHKQITDDEQTTTESDHGFARVSWCLQLQSARGLV